ncbi:MAG: DUF5716 family protein [Lachnospiraceae bacterium]|nr:DUF5716 family protein [Lachnospiraceae bacterium]
MIQEKSNLVLGISIAEGHAQITYFNSAMKEPATVSISETEENFMIPMPEGLWEAVLKRQAAVKTEEKFMPTEEALAVFFQKCFDLMAGQGEIKKAGIMVTVRSLTKNWSELIPNALIRLGIERKNIFLQDFKSSFYYYTINQKKELWNGDVALLEYVDETMMGFVLHVDKSTRPALVTVEKAGEQLVSERIRDGREAKAWDKERDRLLFELLKKVFERRNVTTSYLVGDYFDRAWAERSFQYLCMHRHAFQGKNLFTKGACYAAMERTGMLTPQDLLFMGSDIIQENMGMYLRIRGKLMYYPIVTAGVNWYEAHHVCELIPDKDTRITLITKPMTGGQEVCHILRLRKFPDRPPRASRLKLTVYFTSASRCCVEVEDMGFGGFYRASGKKWKREIRFPEAGGDSVK